MRIGIGFDTHRLIAERALILGGVEFDYPLGLLGHSDADVLTHAVCDALLGALGEPDLGQQFPPDKEEFRDISSLLLLERVVTIMTNKGYQLNNLDCIVIGEQPKINPRRGEIIANYCQILQCQPDQISLKATTTEGLGFCGRNEGLASWAAVTIKKKGE